VLINVLNAPLQKSGNFQGDTSFSESGLSNSSAASTSFSERGLSNSAAAPAGCLPSFLTVEPLLLQGYMAIGNGGALCKSLGKAGVGKLWFGYCSAELLAG
jgi:hypothetical protein